MLDGLWSVTFTTNMDGFSQGVSVTEGSGVIVFNNNIIMGGDTIFYYTGSYEFLEDNKIKGLIHVSRFIDSSNNIGVNASPFGHLPKFDLEFVADVKGDEIIGTGTLVQYDSVTFGARLLRRFVAPAQKEQTNLAL